MIPIHWLNLASWKIPFVSHCGSLKNSGDSCLKLQGQFFCFLFKKLGE